LNSGETDDFIPDSENNVSYQTLDILLNFGAWKNTKLEILTLFFESLVLKDVYLGLQSVREFLKLNTSVKEIRYDYSKLDFSEELKFNNQIVKLPGDFPKVIYYLERNKNLEKISSHFQHKMISQVGFYDCIFRISS
jgi:hypothetical protein